MTERIVTDWTTASPSPPHQRPVLRRPVFLIGLVTAIAVGIAGYFLLSGGDEVSPTIDSRSVIDEDAGNQFIGL